MKWYAGYIAEIIAFIGYIVFEARFLDVQDVGIINFSTFIIAALIAGFIGGFLSPYHVTRVSKYAASTFAIIAGIPAIAFFIISGSILSGDDDSGFLGVIVLIVVLVAGIVLIILIILVSILLILGGFLGAMFGKMVFQEEIQYNQPQEVHNYQQPQQVQNYPQHQQEQNYQQPHGNMVTCMECNTTQERRNFCVSCGSELQVK